MTKWGGSAIQHFAPTKPLKHDILAPKAAHLACFCQCSTPLLVARSRCSRCVCSRMNLPLAARNPSEFVTSGSDEFFCLALASHGAQQMIRPVDHIFRCARCALAVVASKLISLRAFAGCRWFRHPHIIDDGASSCEHNSSASGELPGPAVAAHAAKCSPYCQESFRPNDQRT
jgi:hypothetical protein